MRVKVLSGTVGIPWVRLVSLIVLQGAFGAGFGAILPADRTPNSNTLPWATIAAITHPPQTNRPVYTTVAAGASYSTIQNALNNCPAGQAVKLSAGVYNIGSSGPIQVPANVTLRGSGPNATIIQCSGGEIIAISQGSSIGGSVSITGGSTQGSSSITVSSASGISAGTFIVISQNNPSWVTSQGEGGGGCSWCGYNTPGQVMAQINRVTAVSGNTLTLERPMYFTFNNSPFIKTIGMVQNAGIEDLATVRTSDPGKVYNIRLEYAAYSWVKNVANTNAGHAHCVLMKSYGCTVRDSIWWNAYNWSSDYGYGLYTLLWNSDHLFENNLVYHARHSLVYEGGGSGCVYAYNVTRNNYMGTSDLSGDQDCHGAHPYMNLFEGNIIGRISQENYWGSSSHILHFRCLSVNNSGAQSGFGYRFGYNAEASVRSNSLVGCIIGQPGDSGNRYADGDWTQCSYALGPSDGSDRSITDPNTATYIHGCYDFIGGGIVWDGGNSDHTIPNSMYLSSKPAWFGNLPWPPIDPTRTSAAQISITNVPAGYRYVYGVWPTASPVATNVPPAITSQPGSVTNLSGTANTLSVSVSGTAPFTYQWRRWGTNTVAGAGGASLTLTNCQTWTNGTFSVVVANAFGSVTSSPAWVWITNAGAGLRPTAAISATPGAGLVPLTVAFSAAGSSSPYGDPLSYSWNFGDGGTSTAASPSHTYSASGSYTVSLSVSNTNGPTTTNIVVRAAHGQSGLGAGYGFEEGSGSVVYDASGGANAGTVTSASWTTSGKFGDALVFSGSSMVAVPDSSALDATAGLTVEAWVYPTDVSASWKTILVKPNGSGDLCYELNGVSESTGTPSFYVSPVTPSGQNLYAPSALPVNTWSHVAATYDGATMRLYVNGVEVANRAQTGAISASSDGLTIGANNYSGFHWLGRIDEVRVYRRALSGVEILTDMASPVLGAALAPPPPAAPRIQ